MMPPAPKYCSSRIYSYFYKKEGQRDEYNVLGNEHTTVWSVYN